MKLIIFSVLIISAVAEKLERIYLPASAESRSADGADFLTAPSKTVPAFSGFRSARPASASIKNYNQFGRNFNQILTPTFRNVETFSGQHIPILRSTNENNGEGSYRFAYETDNSIVREEEGHQEAFGQDKGNVVHGSYSYQSPDGQLITVNYIADENGFRASGNHLPTSPPVPEAIARSLSLNYAGGQRLVDNSGAYSETSEAHDLDSVNVGNTVNNGVDRRYLAPLRSNNEGYKY